MNPKELRLGNIINAGNNTPATVLAISDNEIRTSKGDLYDGEWEGVPINRDMLLQFGFENISETKFKLIDCEVDDWYKEAPAFKMIWWELGLHILYIHHLQNLYFYITGVELILIKPLHE